MPNLIKKKFDHVDLMNRIADIHNQPDWRTEAKTADAYYDNQQLASDVIETLKVRGQPITMHNLIGPAIDGVLGMEAKTRTDLIVESDDPDDEMEMLAEAVNSEFSDACRLGRMDSARSDAYANQVKSGIGFVEVYKNPDPFGPKYKIKNVPRDEVYWDWFSKEKDWSDCKWVMRDRWIDVEELKTLFDSKTEILDWAVNDFDGFVNTDIVEGQDPDLNTARAIHRTWRMKEIEYLSEDRRRIKLQIIYQRKYRMVNVLKFENGRVVKYNREFIPHQVALALGKAKLERAQMNYITETWFAGPYYLGERECETPHGLYPIVPFFGYRRASDNAPYGLIARAIPAQNEVNLRRIKLTWLLQAKRVIADEDATNLSRDELLEEIERPDGYIPLNPDRRKGKSISEVIKVEQDFNVAAQQFTVMQESQKLIQDCMGIYSAFLGQEGGADSGVAIANLVEQGATTLAEINDNYRLGSQLVGELLLGFILNDMKGHKNKAIVINRKEKHKRKTIVINEQTEEGVSNDITRLRAHIALAPIQQTATYKAQLAERMMKLTAQLPPEVQASVIDMVVELSDIPNKPEFMERVRSSLNIPKDPEEMTPEERQAAQAKAQQEQKQMQLAFREMAAKVAKLEGEAEKVKASANGQQYDDKKKQADTALVLKQMQKLTEEINAMKAHQEQFLQDQIDSIVL